MNATVQLIVEVLVSSVLIGGLYAIVALGFSISFGLVGVVNLAHTVLVVVGAYCALYLARLGLDPVAAGVALMPVFGVLGYAGYRAYAVMFDRRNLPPLSGMTFFFGLMFVLEVGLTLVFGVDYQFVTPRSASGTLELFGIVLPWRLLTPFLAAVAVTLALTWFMRRTFFGQALAGVAQDELAVRLVGADPVHIKGIGFGLALATASLAGSLLIVAAPVYPSSGREFIGRMFAVAVLGGAGSPRGALAAGALLGVVENLVQAFAGAQWAVATGYGMLLAALAFRPQGMFSR